MFVLKDLIAKIPSMGIWNIYYRKDTDKLIEFITPKKAGKLVIRDKNVKVTGKYDYLILENLIGDIKDVQKYFLSLKRHLNKNGKILVTYYNHLWEPLLKLASSFGLRKAKHEQNWLDNEDIKNLLELSGYDLITLQRRLLIPVNIPIVSSLANRFLAHLPLFNSLCLTTWAVARLKSEERKDYSVSVIVPAKNEEGNIKKIIKDIPKFGKWQEVIFVEGGSADHTWSAITNLKFLISKRQALLISKQIPMSKKPIFKKTIKAYKQKGKGKADAVRLGFNKANGDILMILDADLTVSPSELTKFYGILAQGRAEFVNGSRLVYPMEKEAMRTLNKLANKLFSLFFTWILGQRFKDTLCGTKALFKKDYQKISKYKNFYRLDPFGDFYLIFGAIKQNLKVIEIPVRYRERVYGSTNISRFKHGLLLAKMTLYAFRKFKAF